MSTIIPKEKAKELVEKFLPEVRGADRYNYNLESTNVFIAKQCALIAVDDTIAAIRTIPSPITLSMIEYYEQVKTEIEKL